MSFALIQKKLEIIPPAKRAPLLELARSIQYTNASRVNHEYLGVLAENLSEESARGVSESLQQFGIETAVLDMSQLATPPRPVEVVNGEVAARGFVTRDIYSKDTVTPWDSVRFLGAARVKLQAKPATSHASLSPTGGVRSEGHGGEGAWVLDVYTLSDHFRIQQNRFNYGYLGARRTMQGADNLRMVAGDLRQFATRAILSGGFRAFLDGGSADHLKMQTVEEENRWHWQQIKR